MPVPQKEPQPSEPHCFPKQSGWQTHVPDGPQVFPDGQLPQLPPQPSSPQTLPPVHCGVQLTQAPSWHFWLAVHGPHEPPQPSSPHTLPEHWAVHGAHLKVVGLQLWPLPQVPQLPPQPSSPQSLPRQLPTQPH